MGCRMQNLLAAALKAIKALEESIEYTQVPAWSPSIEQRREALQALQAALREGLEPAGWKLVPLSPTPTMIRAHDEVLSMVDRVWSQPPALTSSAYRAMLLTAPRYLDGALNRASGVAAASTPTLGRYGTQRPRQIRRVSL